ncbi:glycosyl hydrolase family 18 protein [Anaerovorax sp. IOR16]|uniref:glycosyl hydrolase family 18 protein n=1 Tax=Anaerovorax sp. IOR16 TaxID=2773458 RepID=UPI0019D306AB|nr:glycosyl hydrolase family 18 protein [Anaerovorax sp. IOR16]
MMKKRIHTTILALSIILLTVFSSSFNYTLAAKPNRTGPAAPTNLKAAVVTDTSITLSWNASTDNVAVKSYYIYRDNSYFASTSATTYTINNLTPATNYQFYIKAKDARKNISTASDIISVTTTSPAQPFSKKVVGYYAAWSSYSGYYPNQIDPSKLTHINYAFANISSDLKITMGYPDIDENNFKLLNELKMTNPSLKTLISIGGWSWSGKFSDAALSDASRTVFAESCIDFIIKYGFDGVDLDWEYPVSGGLTSNSKRPEDKQNFTLLLQKLREKLDEQGTMDNKHYLLTIAGGASSSYLNNIEITKLSQYIDYATIMTYDLHGTWDNYTDLHAPLFNNNDSSPQYKGSVDSSVNAWINASFPSDKLILGIPFYGYIYSSVTNSNNGLYQTYGGANSISYQKIAENYLNQHGFIRYFHSQSLVPWLFNGSTFISYEDPQSISYKTDYIKTKNLGGAMIWELSQDPNEVLLNTLYNEIK